MYIFTFIFLYLLKKIINILGGNYINSLSSISFLINIYAPGDTYLDIILISLTFVSSIHHSIRHLYRTKFNKFVHCCDSGLIGCLTSYLLLKNFNIYPITLSFLITNIIIIFEYFYNLKIIKKLVTALCFMYIIYLNPVFIFYISVALFFFFNSNKWDQNNIYRYGWHVSSSLCILYYLINYSNF